MTRVQALIASVCIATALSACASKQAAEGPAAAPAATAAESSAPIVEVTASSLNVRATPSATGAVLGSLKRGDQARAPEAASRGWLLVETDTGLKGYVAAKYVREIAEGAAEAPAAEPAAEAAPAPAAAASGAGAPAPGSKLARVTAGMTEAQVIEILGAPTSQQNYMTGKAWIPFYYGPDTGRLDYRYKGVGIVSFSRSRYSGGTKVIKVTADPSEDGLP